MESTAHVELVSRQKRIAGDIVPEAALEHWSDWRWQVRHAVRDIGTFERLLGVRFGGQERFRLDRTVQKFPLSITPYYLSLIDARDFRNDPVFKQAFPSPQELEIAACDMADPLHEEEDSPVPGITHRYGDRVLFHVSNVCAMYCRHCTRKRKVGDVDSIPDDAQIAAGIDYVRRTPAVRDVLLSGGDPLLLPDERLDRILGELRRIPHVEIVRIGTRTPVVLPMRITEDLVAMLRRHQPLWINTHFNHPREFTAASRRALARLADGGFPLGNQSVLLAGVNDCSRIMKALVHKLVANRVRPYYLFQCDLSEGLSHFRTPIGKGIEIVENLVGHTSGLAVPTYVIDAPGGAGKIPILPNYLVSWSTHKAILRNYEGVISTYIEPDSYPIRECNRRCGECNLQLNTADASEEAVVGVARLLCDHEDDMTLVPENNERLRRRDEA